MDSLAPSERHCYTHENRTIYEWDQTLSEVNIYIEVPPGVRAKQLFVEVKQSHIKIGIKPNPPYLDVRHPSMPLMCEPGPAGVKAIVHIDTSIRPSLDSPCCVCRKIWLSASKQTNLSGH